MLLFAKGAVMPQDPILGVPVGKPWIADRCKVSAQRGYTVTNHALVLGAVVTDAVKRDQPDRLTVEYLCSDTASTGHPVPSFPGRRLSLLAGFMTVEAKGAPFILYVRSFPPLKDYAMESVTTAEDDDLLVVRISVAYKRLSFTSLAVSALAIDAELLAAGIMPL